MPRRRPGRGVRARPDHRSQRQTYEIARRLHRGERIYEDDPLPPDA